MIPTGKTRLLFVLILLLVAAGGGYAWYWNMLAGGMRDGFQVWMDQRRAEGLQVEASDLVVSGFPYHVRADLAALDLIHGKSTEPGYWHWQGRQITATLSPQNPWQLHFSTTAPQLLAFADGQGQMRNIRVAARTALGSLIFTDAGQPENADMMLEQIELSGSALIGPVQAGRVQARAAIGAQTDVDIQGSDIHLPEQARPLFGSLVKLARLKSSLTGYIPRTWSGPQLLAWQQSGGQLKINRSRLKWGPLDLTTNGTISLDNLMRPIGTGIANIRGYKESIRSLADRGLITPLNAAALTIGLNVMGQQNGGAIRLPLEARDGLLKVGSVSSIRLRPLRFPGE